MRVCFFAHNKCMKKSKILNGKIIPIHQIGLPIVTDFIIPEDDSVRLLFKVTEGLDYSKLYETYSTIGRNPAIAPETLFRIIVYGNMERIYSSRDLEKACRRDINFKWLLQGQEPPEHNTIARFRSERLTECIEDLFNQLIIKLYESKEIEFENIFIDGTKIEANANRYSFVWKKATDKFEIKLQEKIRKILPEIISTYNFEFVIPDKKISVLFITSILEELNNIKENENLIFVNGKGKRKSKLQKYVEALNDFVERQTKYDSYNNIFDGRNSFSKTDNDATFMRMKEDHMKNGQLKPAYNIQIGVEGEYIIGVDISSERSDQLTFIPFLDKMKENLPKKIENIIADSGYESEENYQYLAENKQNAYIKPQTYEKAKTKKFKSDISKRENMVYDEETDSYTCAYGKRLVVVNSKITKSKSGFTILKTIYECESCDGCPYKNKCTKAKKNRQLHVSKNFIEKRKNSLSNITNEKGILLRMNRSIQVEGAFGVIKEDYGLRRFLLRGKANVKTEMILIAFGYNINKLYNKTTQKRNGRNLHKIEVS